MFGYMTEKEAKRHGFTHHAEAYGIPLWITDDECSMVAAKFAPLDPVLNILLEIDCFLQSIIYPHEDVYFRFKILRKISDEESR